MLSMGVGLLVLGVGPLQLAELARKAGFDSVGFGLMWGMTFGLFFTVIGVVLILVGGILYLIKPSKNQ